MNENNQQNITKDISPEETGLQNIAKEWLDARRREHWMLTLWTVFAVIAVIVLVLNVLDGGIAQYVWLVGFSLPLIVWGFICYRDHAALLHLRQEHPTIEQQEALMKYDPPKRSSGLVWRIAVLVICCMVFGIFGVLLVPLLFSRPVKIKNGSTLLKQIQKTNAQHRSNLSGILVLLVFLSVGAFLFYALLDFVASDKVNSANSCARMVYNAVTAWQTESEAYDKDIPLKTEIYYISEEMTPDEESVAYNIYLYFSNNGDYWCAVVCDEDGEILYTFYSEEEITEDELVPMEREQQKKIETNLFTRGEVVGWYAPQEE